MACVMAAPVALSFSGEFARVERMEGVGGSLAAKVARRPELNVACAS